MVERKETIKLITGEEREVELGFLSYQKRNDILKQCTVTKVIDGKTTSELDIFSLQTDTLKHTLRNAKVDEILSEDGDDIFQKYFGKSFGMGGDDKGN